MGARRVAYPAARGNGRRAMPGALRGARAGLIALALLSGAVASAQRGAPAMPADLARATPEQIIAHAERAHPADLYMLAARLMAAGRKDEAVRWFYIGQLRYRYHLLAQPSGAADAGALFAALSESVGRPINEYAFGDVDAATAAIDAALAWDAAHANRLTPKDRYPVQLAETRAGLIALRDDMRARKQEIRESRTRNGLENR